MHSPCYRQTVLKMAARITQVKYIRSNTGQLLVKYWSTLFAGPSSMTCATTSQLVINDGLIGDDSFLG